MRRLAPMFLAVAAGGMCLAACEDTYYGNGYGYGYGPTPYAYGYAPYGYGYVSGYYDDFYGPFYDGYWGPDAYFYYRTSPGGAYIRDDAGHFRHDPATGYRTFHARAAAHVTPQAAPPPPPPDAR
jgi:hypothetical protein